MTEFMAESLTESLTEFLTGCIVYVLIVFVLWKLVLGVAVDIVLVFMPAVMAFCNRCTQMVRLSVVCLVALLLVERVLLLVVVLASLVVAATVAVCRVLH